MQVGEKKRPTIGVLAGAQVYYGTIPGNFIRPLLQGVCSVARDYDCNLLLACGMEHDTVLPRPAWPVPSPDVDFVPVGPWNTDGLIVINPLESKARSRYVQDLVKAGFPVVFTASGETGPTVAVDNEDGVHQAIAHLIEHGHRAIAFIAGDPRDENGDSGARLKAYHKAVQRYSLVASPELVAYGYHGIDGGVSAMRQILGSGVPFTAVLASNDESAIGTMQALQAAGLRIPQDVAIIGFDDTLEALIQTPPLTTLHYSPADIGYQALELLLEYIAGRKTTTEMVRIPVRLAVRQSCGCQLGAKARAAASAAAQPVPAMDRTTAISQLVQTMTENVMAEAQRLSLAEAHAMCSRLVGAFLSSLKSGEATALCEALDEILSRTETLDGDVHVWHAALSALEERLELLLNIGHLSTMRQHAEKMLSQARVTVSESVRQQFRRYVVHRQWTNDRVGLLNAGLLAVTDEPQIFEVLARYLSQMGVQRAGVVFFEPEGDDPLAWSVLHSIPPVGEPSLRFPSKKFPPPALYDEPFSLALLPLARLDKAGFAVFDTAHLDVYATIVWQLITFFRVVRLYQQVAEHRSKIHSAIPHLQPTWADSPKASSWDPKALWELRRSRWEGRTILIADDDPHALDMYAHMVAMGAPETQVLKARSGREAIDMIQQACPDLVLLDLSMPEVDGFKVLETMQGEMRRNVPVIVLTEQILTQADMARLYSNVTSILHKRLFSMVEILAHIEAALNRNKNLGGTAQRLARNAMAYIHEHYEETVSLESVAGHLGVSKEHLARCFREETGVTLGTYINRYRVERAKSLLQEKDKRVVDVAMEVGFSSGAYFSRIFKQEVGKPPQIYRQVC